MALPTPSKSVLVARADIKRGQILRAGRHGLAGLAGGRARQELHRAGRSQEAAKRLPAGSPATRSAAASRSPKARIIAPGNRGFLAAVLRPGMRAISVPVTVTSGISGFIFPGDQVDLLLTYSVPAPPVAGTDKEKVEL